MKSLKFTKIGIIGLTVLRRRFFFQIGANIRELGEEKTVNRRLRKMKPSEINVLGSTTLFLSLPNLDKFLL